MQCSRGLHPGLTSCRRCAAISDASPTSFKKKHLESRFPRAAATQLPVNGASFGGAERRLLTGIRPPSRKNIWSRDSPGRLRRNFPSTEHPLEARSAGCGLSPVRKRRVCRAYSTGSRVSGDRKSAQRFTSPRRLPPAAAGGVARLPSGSRSCRGTACPSRCARRC